MDKKLHCQISLNLDDNQLDRISNVSLEYYILESIYKDDELSETNTYGIEVVKKELANNNVINIEQESASHLSVNKEIVEELLEKLSRNTVTPVGLHDVLENLVGVAY